ncbi:MAG: metal-sensing transcriptional repressor [Anaerolineae bacterium]
MTKKVIDSCTTHDDRTDHNQANLRRIRRIQGQLESLARVIEADDETCEQRVIRARTIEKGMTSLINHLVQCYIDNTLKLQMQDDPEATSEEIVRLFNLMNR